MQTSSDDFLWLSAPLKAGWTRSRLAAAWALLVARGNRDVVLTEGLIKSTFPLDLFPPLMVREQTPGYCVFKLNRFQQLPTYNPPARNGMAQHSTTPHSTAQYTHCFQSAAYGKTRQTVLVSLLIFTAFCKMTMIYQVGAERVVIGLLINTNDSITSAGCFKARSLVSWQGQKAKRF